MKEVTSAVVATSLVLISVFVPVSFFPGTTGILYKQFSLTIAFSIAISLFNALTLSPALAAILLRGEEHKYSVFDWTRIGWLSRGYRSVCPRSRPRDSRPGQLATAGPITADAEDPLRDGRALRCGTGRDGLHVPSRAHRLRAAGRPELLHRRGAGAAGSVAVLHHAASRSEAEKVLLADPDVFGTFAVPGFSLSGGSSSNYGLIFAPLKPIDQRKAQGHAASDIVARVSPKLFGIPGAIVVAFEPPAIQGIGSFGGFQFELQDLGRNTLQDLDDVAHKIVAASRQRKDLTGLVHQLHRQRSAATGADRSRKGEGHGSAIEPGHAGARRLHGLAVRQRFRLQQSFLPRVRAGRPAVPHDARSDLRQYYVRSDTNGLVPLGNIVTLKDTAGPQVINHFNLFRSAEIDGAAAPGFSSGQGLKAMEELAQAEHAARHVVSAGRDWRWKK